MRIRALASDYDDTLAREGVVAPQTVARVLTARRAGVKIVLVTGRRMPELLEVFDPLGLVDLIVAENGGYLYSPGSAVGWRTAPAVDRDLSRELRERGVDLTEGETLIATTAPYSDLVDEVLQRRTTAPPYIAIRNRESIMLLPEGVDKGSGLLEALRFLRIAPESCVAIGDAENDVALLSSAGCGVAVGDALDVLRCSADLVMTGAGPEGFSELVERLASADWELPRHKQARAG